MKKTLVVYCTRTGHTETVARQLAAALNADLERIGEAQERAGPSGYLRCAMEALLGVHPVIHRSTHRPQDYELVVVGTPIWFWSVSSPVRSYLRRHRTHIARVAVFCTMGGSGGSRVLADMERLLGRPALASLALKEQEIASGECTTALSDFEHDIRSAQTPPARLHKRPRAS